MKAKSVLITAFVLFGLLPRIRAEWHVDSAKTEQILSKMTFEDKIAEINLGSGGLRCTKPNQRLGIPPTRGINGPRGPADHVMKPEDAVNVCYPVPLAMAATWDEVLMDRLGEEWGKAMIEIADVTGNGRNNLFGTGLNACMHPLAGRNSEYLGEDPLLAGKIGAALSRGLQEMGCIATIKHYACNDFETGRNTVDVQVSDRVLRELILRPFEICIKESNALGVMTGYNLVNGHYCSANAELLRILRKDFGFKGIVVSDYAADMEGAAAALNAGSNLENAGGHTFAAKEVKAALDSGALKQETLDQRVREILQVKLSKEYYDGSKKHRTVDLAGRRKFAREVAAQSMVLLKNEGNLLPLKPGMSVALIGPFADPDYMLGNQGSSSIRPERTVGLQEELEQRAKGGLTVERGCGPADTGDGVAHTEFTAKAEYFNNLDLSGQPALVRTENSIQKLSFTGGGTAELANEGVFGKSLLFSGQSVAKLGDFSGWDAKQDFTVSFWVNFVDQFPKDVPVFSLQSPPKDDFIIGPTGLSVSTTRVVREKTKLSLEIPSLKWAHVAVVRKNGELTAFVDGKAVGKAPMNFPFPCTPLYIGGASGGKAKARAMMSDVRIYSAALAEDEVRRMAGKELVSHDLAFHAPCDKPIKSPEDESYPGITEVRNMSARWSGTLSPKRSGKHAFEFITTGGLRVFLNGKKVIEEFGQQMAMGNNLLIWPVLEAGKSYDLRIEFSNCSRHGQVLRFSWFEPPKVDLFAAARTAAKGKDAAIVAVGVHQNLLQGEANDNESFDLPGYQAELIEAVASVNPNTIVVLCSCGGVAMRPWIAKTPAVLEAFFPGQEAGNSVADVLYGDVNPSGKLPMTYPESLDQIPFTVADPNYGEDLCRYGYRLFDKRNLAPQFPFGHGLSYTKFEYSNLQLSNSGKDVIVTLKLKNTGARPGAEIVQLYAGLANVPADRPVRELKAFSKIALQPGEEKPVRLVVPRDSLAVWDTAKQAWSVPAGEFAISVGSSSRDVRLHDTITLN